MTDPELEESIIRELAKLRHELALVSDPKDKPLGPPDFMRRYITQLKRRIKSLEEELAAGERGPR